MKFLVFSRGQSEAIAYRLQKEGADVCLIKHHKNPTVFDNDLRLAGESTDHSRTSVILEPGTGKLADVVSKTYPVFGQSAICDELLDDCYRKEIMTRLGIKCRDNQSGLGIFGGAIWNGQDFIPGAFCSYLMKDTYLAMICHQNASPRLFQATFDKMREFLRAKKASPNFFWVEAVISRTDTNPYVVGIYSGLSPAIANMVSLSGGKLSTLIDCAVNRKPIGFDQQSYCVGVTKPGIGLNGAWLWNDKHSLIEKAQSAYALKEKFAPILGDMEIDEMEHQVVKFKLLKRLRYF